jgi:uncharacterized membrane protein (DUF106 family)
MFGLKKMMNSLSYNKIVNHCKSVISNKTSNSILHNRVLLYAILLLALLDLFYLANVKDFTSVIVFILVGILTSFFCKNMIVILFVAICITHILKYPRSLEGAENMNEEEKENMENEEDKENMENEEDKENMENEDEEKKENMENKKNTEEMTKEMKEFMEVQNKIIGGMADLEPLMQKAEGFIQKFEKYNN